MKALTALALCCGIALSTPALAADKPEDIIKARQAAYQFLAWNTHRIKNNVDNPTQFNKDEVVRAANAVQAVANAGLGALYAPGTDKGTGYGPSRLKADALNPANGAKLGQIATDFIREANAMATVAATGEVAAVSAQLDKLRGTCKACHDNFRNK